MEIQIDSVVQLLSIKGGVSDVQNTLGGVKKDVKDIKSLEYDQQIARTVSRSPVPDASALQGELYLAAIFQSLSLIFPSNVAHASCCRSGQVFDDALT